MQVCELDIIFNFEKAYFILDEFLMGGEIQDTSKKSVLKAIEQADLLQEVIWTDSFYALSSSAPLGSDNILKPPKMSLSLNSQPESDAIANLAVKLSQNVVIEKDDTIVTLWGYALLLHRI